MFQSTPAIAGGRIINVQNLAAGAPGAVVSKKVETTRVEMEAHAARWKALAKLMRGQRNNLCDSFDFYTAEREEKIATLTRERDRALRVVEVARRMDFADGGSRRLSDALAEHDQAGKAGGAHV